MKHQPLCDMNMVCAVYHENGLCDRLKRCTCKSLSVNQPDREQQKREDSNLQRQIDEIGRVGSESVRSMQNQPDTEWVKEFAERRGALIIHLYGKPEYEVAERLINSMLAEAYKRGREDSVAYIRPYLEGAKLMDIRCYQFTVEQVLDRAADISVIE